MKRISLLLLSALLLFLFACNREKPAPKKTENSQPIILSTTVAPNSAFKMSVAFDPPQPLMSKKTKFTLTVTAPSGAPVDGATVKASLVMPLMDMGKNGFPLEAKGKGVYQGDGQFTMSGEWEAIFTAEAAGKSGKTTFNVRVED